MSKNQQHFCPRRKQNSDDVLSSPTVCTEESTIPPSPRSGMDVYRRSRDQTMSKTSSIPSNTRSSASISSPSREGYEKGPSLHYHHRHNSEMVGMNLLPRRDSDPGRNRSQTIPVVQRRSRPMSFVGQDGGPSSAQHDAETDEYLQRMYDSRTWEMYRRITEARKNSNYSYDAQTTPLEGNEYNKENTSEWENLNHDYLDSSDRHEMIFLFDFD